jgi:hypothetical protein
MLGDLTKAASAPQERNLANSLRRPNERAVERSGSTGRTLVHKAPWTSHISRTGFTLAQSLAMLRWSTRVRGQV